jgi:4'-phosphopantetheinyl transferase
LSLEQNASSGNAARESPRITVLASPMPDIRLWWCDVRPSPRLLPVYERCLSDAERSRASRFGTVQLRERYVMGRGSLREILGRELGVRAESVDIVRGTRGRPQLAGSARLDFNISHTATVAIVGIARNARIGVDVERTDRIINVAGIARKFFTGNERGTIDVLGADDARRRALTLWTCKEAMSKATGDGLSAPFAEIDISLRDGPAVRRGFDRYDPDRWVLYRAAVPPEYVATVALWNPR